MKHDQKRSAPDQPKVRDDGTYVVKGEKESACDVCHRKKEEHKICKTFCKYCFPPIRWEPAACPNCGAHIEGLRYRGREAEIDRQGLEHRELSAGFKEWKYEE